MKQYEEIVRTVDNIVNQLEKLAYSKNVALSLKLAGGVDALVNVLEISADHWNKRVQQALLNVVKDPPKVTDMNADNIPKEVLDAATVPLLLNETKAPPPSPTL